MIINKWNIVWISCFYSVLSKTFSYIIYINKNISKAEPMFRGQVEVNQPCYYTSVLMITRTKPQKLVWQSFKHNETCKKKYYYYLDSVRIKTKQSQDQSQNTNLKTCVMDQVKNHLAIKFLWRKGRNEDVLIHQNPSLKHLPRLNHPFFLAQVMWWWATERFDLT